MAAQALSSDLFPSALCSGGIAFSGEASSSVNCKLPTEQVDAGLSSTVISANRIAELQQFVGSIESRILDAFKQAISEVVEHVAKEAATRVGMAERKALKLDQELVHVKQQALAMLLQMKQSTDLRIAERERVCLGERKRAEDAEGKLFILQQNVEWVKDEPKKQGLMAETMKKDREQGIRLSSSNGEEDGRNVKIKFDQPEMNMDNLLLFAGVACEDASTPCSSFVQDLPSKASTAANQSKSKPVASLPFADKRVAKSITRNSLRNGEQLVKQCTHLQKEKACISLQEQALPEDLARGVSLSNESNFQLTRMQTLKSVEKHQMLLPSIGARKSKATLQHCVNDFKSKVEQKLEKVDHHRMHPMEGQSLDAHSALSCGADSDNVCSCVDVAEGQNAEILLPMRVSPKFTQHAHSILNTVVGDDDDGMPCLSYTEFQNVANRSKPECENPGTCPQFNIAQSTERVMTNSFFHEHGSLFCSEGMTPNSRSHKLGYAGQSNVCCKESLPKCTKESSKGHLNADDSETMEIRSFTERNEVPGCILVHSNPLEEPAADGSSISVSPNMDADTNVSECGVVVDSKNSHEKFGTGFSGKRSYPYLAATTDARTQERKLNGQSKLKKQNKDGDKRSLEISDILLEEDCFKQPRASPPKTQSGSSYLTKTKSNHKLSEAQNPLSLTVESSRHSRRLMQGARQLFLLAERKWH